MNSPGEIAIKIAVGEIAVLFSNIEFAFASILSQLLDPSQESIAGSLVCDSFTLSQTIRHIRKVATFRFCHDDTVHSRLVAICAKADSLRDTRNLFIHGMWIFDPNRLAKGEIVCLDMKWRTGKKEKHWSRAEEHVFNLTTLDEVLVQVRQVQAEAFTFTNELKTSQMMPMAQGLRQQQNNTPEPIVAKRAEGSA